MKLLRVTVSHPEDGWFRFQVPVDGANKVVQGHSCTGTTRDDEGYKELCTLLAMNVDGISQIDFGAEYGTARYWETDLRSLTIESGCRVQMWDSGGTRFLYTIGSIVILGEN